MLKWLLLIYKPAMTLLKKKQSSRLRVLIKNSSEWLNEAQDAFQL